MPAPYHQFSIRERSLSNRAFRLKQRRGPVVCQPSVQGSASLLMGQFMMLLKSRGHEETIVDTVAFLKQIYTHDRETLFGAMSPDFTLHSPGQNLIAGKYYGPEGFEAHVAHMKQLCNDSFEEELLDTFLANDRFGMVVHRMTAERNGKKLDMFGFGLWGFRDGLLTDHWEAVGDQDRWDDFWS